MDADSTLSAIPAILPLVGTVLQTFTALAAVTIGVITYRYTRRQSALTLINHNNTLANLVNTTVIQSEPARDVLGRVHEFVVGCPDDAVLFLYLNYVHNTFRMRQIGAVSTQVWQDTLACCATLLSKLRREQVERLLARGYEAAFQAAVLARFDAAVPLRELMETDVLTTLRPRSTRAPRSNAA